MNLNDLIGKSTIAKVTVQPFCSGSYGEIVRVDADIYTVDYGGIEIGYLRDDLHIIGVDSDEEHKQFMGVEPCHDVPSFEDKYPEHTKFKKVADKIAGTIEFCDHLRDSGLRLAEMNPGLNGWYQLTHKKVATHAAIHEYFGIDYDKFMKEKDQMLAEVRAND